MQVEPKIGNNLAATFLKMESSEQRLTCKNLPMAVSETLPSMNNQIECLSIQALIHQGVHQHQSRKHKLIS